MPDSTAPGYLADMNISPISVRDLRNDGWSIIRVSEVLAADSADDLILDYAREHGLVIITHDLDFSRLLAVGGHDGPSVINLRLDEPSPGRVAKRLRSARSTLIDLIASKGAVITITDAAIRYRRLPFKSTMS